MTDPARARKLARRIRRIVAEVIERTVADPRLGMVTVTDVRVSPDLRVAVVYYTVFGGEADRAAAAAALERATGVLRTAVGQGTGVRFTPELRLVADPVPQVTQELEEAMRRARSADAELAERRRGASPAGDPDPYRPARTAAQESG